MSKPKLVHFLLLPLLLSFCGIYAQSAIGHLQYGSTSATNLYTSEAVATSDGGMALVGQATLGDAAGLFLVKMDGDQQVQWSQFYENSLANVVKEGNEADTVVSNSASATGVLALSDGGYLCYGSLDSSTAIVYNDSFSVVFPP